jgi:hypothetical protein
MVTHEGSTPQAWARTSRFRPSATTMRILRSPAAGSLISRPAATGCNVQEINWTKKPHLGHLSSSPSATSMLLLHASHVKRGCRVITVT